MSLRGCLDSVTSSGFAEGWAYDTSAPLQPLYVSILHQKEEVAQALAHMYRSDLAEAGCGTGWCAFRARLSVPTEVARDLPLGLVDKATGESLQIPNVLRFLEDGDLPVASVESLIEQDPTALGSVERLNGCNEILVAFLKTFGAERYVQAAFLYVLGRPADKNGLSSYTSLIRQSLLEPMDLLRILSRSEEYAARKHMLSAPGSSSFPFQLHEG